jgi:hypothetical protein
VGSELKRKLDYSDLLAAPDDGKRYELVQGDLFVNPSPSPLHQRISKRSECHRLKEGAFRRLVDAEGETTLVHPEWTDLVVDLPALWR